MCSFHECDWLLTTQQAIFILWGSCDTCVSLAACPIQWCTGPVTKSSFQKLQIRPGICARVDTSRKLSAMIRSRVSDNWKSQVVPYCYITNVSWLVTDEYTGYLINAKYNKKSWFQIQSGFIWVLVATLQFECWLESVVTEFASNADWSIWSLWMLIGA